MFQATRHAHQALVIAKRVQSVATTLYAGLLEPIGEREAVYSAVSWHIQKLRPQSDVALQLITTEDRRLMHTYASTLLFQGSSSEPPRSLDMLLAIHVYHLVQAQKLAYQRHHPLKTWLKAVA